MQYLNPPAAISLCREQGKRTPGELYSCALGKMPHADSKWTRVARRLAEEQGHLDGAPTCIKWHKYSRRCVAWSDGWTGSLRGSRKRRRKARRR